MAMSGQVYRTADTATALYAEPRQDSPIITQLAKGTRIELIKNATDGGIKWTQVLVIDGPKGFVGADTKLYQKNKDLPLTQRGGFSFSAVLTILGVGTISGRFSDLTHGSLAFLAKPLIGWLLLFAGILIQAVFVHELFDREK